MAYLVAADFRVNSPEGWTQGLTLDSTQATDAALTSAIAAQSQWVDEQTHDHFEPETGLTLILTGRPTRRLYLPKRIRAITSVGIMQFDQTYVIQDSKAYEVTSSISGSTVNIRASDYLEVYLPPSGAQSYPLAAVGTIQGTGVWPRGANQVQVIGDFSWPACPDAIKRAVAIKVWNQFLAFDASQDAAGPGGMDEVASIVKTYERKSWAA